MSPRDPAPRPQNPKPPIIPPDPPPDPPGEAPQTPDEQQPATRRKGRESHPDLGDRRHIPRTPDPPLVIGRRSRENYVHDSRSTPSVGSGAWPGFDLLHIHDR